MTELTIIWDRRSERSMKECAGYHFSSCCKKMEDLLVAYSNGNIKFISIGYNPDIRDTSTGTEGKDETKTGRRKGLFFVIKDVIFTTEGYDLETDYIKLDYCPFCGEEIIVKEEAK